MQLSPGDTENIRDPHQVGAASPFSLRAAAVANEVGAPCQIPARRAASPWRRDPIPSSSGAAVNSRVAGTIRDSIEGMTTPNQPSEKPVVETPKERTIPRRVDQEPVVPKIDEAPTPGGDDRALPRRPAERPIPRTPTEKPVVGGEPEQKTGAKHEHSQP